MPLYIIPESGEPIPYRWSGPNPPGIAVYAKTALGAKLRAPHWYAAHQPAGQAKAPLIPREALESAAAVTLPRGELGKLAERIAWICGELLDGSKGAKYVRVPRDTMLSLYQLSDELESKLDRKE